MTALHAAWSGRALSAAELGALVAGQGLPNAKRASGFHCVPGEESEPHLQLVHLSECGSGDGVTNRGSKSHPGIANYGAQLFGPLRGSLYR